jgi:ABC-type uncharacterized transport system substrate-binding protein
MSIIALAARHRVPAIYEDREFVQDGGLISYGPSIAEMTRRSAAFVDKILRGAHLGERLSVQSRYYKKGRVLREKIAVVILIQPQVEVAVANE